MRIKHFKITVKLVKKHLAQYMVENGITIKGNKCQCFPAGTPVITSKGWRNIETIKKNDLVFNETRNLRKVKHTFKQMGEEFTTININQGLDIKSTSLHKYYVVRENKLNNTFTNLVPDLVPAKYIKEGDFLMSICPDPQNTNNLTNRQCIVMGMYIADGHSEVISDNHGKVRFSFHKKEQHLAKFVESTLNKDYKLANKAYVCHNRENKDSCTQTIVSDINLAKELDKWGKREDKCIPDDLFLTFTTEQKKYVLFGYLLGDGHKTRKNYICAATISKKLLYQMYLCALCNSYTPSIVTHYAKANRKTTYTLSLSLFYRAAQNVVTVNYNNKPANLIKVKSVNTKKEILPVYNLNIDKEENYLIHQGILVKNCINHSIHSNSDLGKLSAGFMPDTNKTKVYCFVENRIFDIFDAYKIFENKPTNGANFFTALEYLCKKYKVPFDKEESFSPKEIERNKKQRLLEELHKVSLKNAKHGVAYYKRRKITKEKIQHFRIGFIKPELVTKELNTKFKNMFDYSLSKTLTCPALVIPVFNEYNQYTALVIRQFDCDKDDRYLNYSIKGKGLYNSNNVKSNDYVYIVEGTFDTIALFPEKNVVGTLTSSINKNDLEFFQQKEFKKIFIALDQDNEAKDAHTDGILKTIMNLKDIDTLLYVVKLPADTDPDEVVSNEGLTAFNNLKKISAISYLVTKLKEEKINNKDIYFFIAACPNIIIKDKYITFMAKQLNIGKRNLLKEIDKISDSGSNINLLEYAKEKDYTEDLLSNFMETAWNHDFSCIPTGYKEYDRLLGGFEDTLYMFIARPEQNKTGILLNFIKHLIQDDSNYVAFYSLDDGLNRAILPRMLALLTGLSSKVIRNPSDDIKDIWEKGMNILRRCKDNYVMKDGSDIRTIYDFEKYIKLHQHIAQENNKKFIIVVDNIHCLVSSGKYEATENMQRVAAYLKKLPQVYGCPIITTAEVPKSAKVDPTGADIKGSIDLWYAARCVVGVKLALTEDSKTNLAWTDKKGSIHPIIELNITKNQTSDCWHGKLYYKLHRVTNKLTECTMEEMETLKSGGYLL